MAGRFITFEGGEGVGKSTQVKLLQGRLAARGIACLTTREPGGSPRAEAIRAAVLAGRGRPFGPFAEALMFSAARHDHLERVIRPALAAGTFVICDRFADSTLAYQGAVGGLDPGLIRALERVVVGETRPDLTVLLDAPARVGLERARRRREGEGTAVDRFEGEDLAFHERLREAFREIAAAEPERCLLLDGQAPSEETAERIWQEVERRFLVSEPAPEATGQGADRQGFGVPSKETPGDRQDCIPEAASQPHGHDGDRQG